MELRFTKASSTDGTLVTLNLAQLDETPYALNRARIRKGYTFKVTFAKGGTATFTVNRVRNGRAVTAASREFAAGARRPAVGRAVNLKVKALK